MKRCCTCKIEKSDTEFHKNTVDKSGLHTACKVCRAKKTAVCRFCGQEKPKTEFKGSRGYCQTCRTIIPKSTQAKCKKTYSNILKRTRYTYDRSYKSYGGKGIQCNLTPADLIKAYIRDKAELLVHPAISRLDHTKHYESGNICWKEWKNARGAGH